MKFTPVNAVTGIPEHHDWVTAEIRRRATQKIPQNTIVAILGEGTSGKSWTAAKLAENLDPTYTASLKNHPVYTQDPETAKYCHLSSSPRPFLEALAGHLLPRGSWFHLDEPPAAVDWWTDVGKTLSEFLTRYNYTIVNVIVCGIMKKKVLSTIRDFAHIQIDQLEPGYAAVQRIRNVKYYSKKQIDIVRKPRWSGYIGPGAQAPSEEWQGLYRPIKDWEWDNFSTSKLGYLRMQEALDRAKIEKLRKAGYLS